MKKSRVNKNWKRKNSRTRTKKTSRLQRAGGPRMYKDIDLIRQSGLYTVDDTNLPIVILTQKASPGGVYRIEFPSKYPFEAPKIDYNGTPIPFVWSLTDNIVNILDAERNGQKVLILCHNKHVTGSFTPLNLQNHWFGPLNLFSRIFSDYGLKGNVSFETVDLLPGGNYKGDAFSDDFIATRQNRYDIVMEPDCGGVWYHLQQDKDSEDENNKNKAELIRLSLNLGKMVKSGGLIMFSKFLSKTPCIINGREFPTFVSALASALNENGFESKIQNLESAGDVLVAKKN